MTIAMDRLKALHEQKRAFQAESEAHLEAMQRIEGPLKAADEVRAKIAALDAQEHAEAMKWAGAGAVGTPPDIDIVTRQKLTEELAKAEAGKASLQAAWDALAQQRVDIQNTKLVRLDQDISIVAAEVMIEKLDELCQDAQRLIGELSPLIADIDSLRPAIVRELHGGSSETKVRNVDVAIFRRLEAIPDTHTMLTAKSEISPDYGKWLRAFQKLNAQGEL